MKAKFIIYTFLGIFFCCQANVFADSQPQQLDEARSLVEQKSYEQALALYSQISDWLRKDPGLVIEWARVYTYANEHKQAIALFEEVRSSHPEREAEIIAELADQYKWDNQLNKSIIVYRKALTYKPNDEQLQCALAQAFAWNKQHKEALDEYDAILARNPQSKDALLSKAELLSWQDKLEQAAELYKEVLKIDPSNVTAQNGVARIRTWQGYYRKAIARYKEILKNHPGNPDALEGLAFAYHWSGDDSRSLSTLETLLNSHPQRNSASRLYNEIKGLKQLHFSQPNRYSHDTNQLTILSDGVHVGKYFGDETNLGATYDWYLYRQPGSFPINADRAGFNVDRRFNEYLELNSYLYLTQFDFKNFSPFTTNTWLTIRPVDTWRFDLGYDREIFDDITALNDEVIVNSGSFSFDYKPDRFWLVSAKYKRGAYSDDNHQGTTLAKIEYRLKQSPYLKLYYNYYHSGWSERLDHGYFNPASIQSHALGIYGSKDLTERLFLESQASAGYEMQDPKSNHPTYFGALGLSYRLPQNWQVSLRGEYFTALDTNPKRTYSKSSAWLAFTYSFGGPQPERLYQGTQPQRPSGH